MLCSTFIYDHMKKYHMNQAAVAREAGLSAKAFNNMLRGRAILREEHVIPLCNALGVTPNELFGYDKSQNRNKKEVVYDFIHKVRNGKYQLSRFV